MTYDGYMALANDDGEIIELVNAARVKAYTDNLAPTLGLRGCNDCEGLPAALGEEYTSPSEDSAPWYDPTDPATGDFYGVYPLGFEGIDDSTRSIESAELTGDGSVVVGSRFTGKDIRVQGVAFAKDRQALSAGVSWLDNALNGTEDGQCFGDRLNIFSSCPPVEVLPPDFATPYTLEVPVTEEEIGQWTTTSGTIIPFAGGEGINPGIRFDWVDGDPQKIACREITGLIPGEQYQLRTNLSGLEGDKEIRIGGECGSSRTNLATNPRLLGWDFFGGAIADTESDVPTGGPLGQGWRQSVATSSNTSSPYVLSNPADEISVTPGTLYQVSIYVLGPEVSTASLVVDMHDSGGTQVGSPYVLESGVAMDGGWHRLSGLVLVPPLGTFPQEVATMRVNVEWDVANGAVQTNDSFGGANLLVEFPNYTVLQENLISEARAEFSTLTWDFRTGDDGAVTGSFVTGAVDGPVLYGSTQSPTYRRNEVTTVATGGAFGPAMRGISQFNFDALTTGMPWVVGAFFRSDRTVSGTAHFQVLNVAADVLEEVTEPFTLTAGTWQYIAGGQAALSDLVDPFEVSVTLDVTGATIGDVYDSTGGMVKIGTSDEEYFDFLRPADPPVAYIQGGNRDGSNNSTMVEVDDVGTYFDGNTIGFRWTGLPDESTSTADVDIDYHTYFGRSAPSDLPGLMTVLDFVPRAETVYLSMTPPEEDTTPATVMVIEGIEIRRVPKPGVLSFGTGYEFVPPTDGWAHVAPPGGEVTWVYGADIDYRSVTSRLRAPSTGGLAYGTTDGMERTVFGLTPGARHRILVEFMEGWSETDFDPTISVNPFITLSDTTGLVVTFSENSTGGTEHFWIIEFTPTSTSTVVGLHPGSTLNLGSYGSVRWDVLEYMVEEILETDGTIPNPGRVQHRTMYEVKASQGPVITNVRNTSCGVMAQVTYSLRAGNPFKYRDPIFAGGLPAGTSVEVVDVPCSEDGLPQIINFLYDPSLEDPEVIENTWLGGGANLTFNGRATSPTARLGDYVYRVQTVAGGGMQINNYYLVHEVASGPIPLGGSVLTVSTYFRVISADTLGTFEWNIFVAMQGFPPISYPAQMYEVTEVGEWYRAETTVTIPDNVSLERIESTLRAPSAAVGGFERDAMMIQNGTEATEPFDQNSPNVEWTGTVGASALAMTQVLEDITEDPDCPVPPAPPLPPQIDDSCIESPTTYNRTVVSIPSDTVPRNLSAYPVITLTAGSGAVRQARIRFWPNPDDLPIALLDPCSYEGEIIVSYLAPEATMVIDGVLETATVSKPGFQDVLANHVLYGPDGGPVEWPELSGGVGYLVTLELDSGEAFTDALMTIELVVKD